MAADSLGRIVTGGRKSLVQWKQFFFDRKGVQAAADAGRLKALAKFGAFVRRAAQTSMRYRKGASPAGSPPSAHKSKQLAALKKMGRTKYNGALLREMLYFAYDPVTRTTVVGPLGFKGSKVPELHEFGGERAAYKGETFLKGKGKSAKLIKLKGVVKYPPRPYMRPALKKTLAKFPLSFRDTISR